MNVPQQSERCCVLCGSTRQLQNHHVGGRNIEFTLPLCHPHHKAITVGLKRLKIETSRKARERIQAIRATTYLLWMLLDEDKNNDREKI